MSSQKSSAGNSKLVYPLTVLISSVTEFISLFSMRYSRLSLLGLYQSALAVKYTLATFSGVLTCLMVSSMITSGSMSSTVSIISFTSSVMVEGF